jgi:hypothetical protein
LLLSLVLFHALLVLLPTLLLRGSVGLTLALLSSALFGSLLLFVLALPLACLSLLLLFCGACILFSLALVFLFLSFLADFLPATAAFTLSGGQVGGSKD